MNLLFHITSAFLAGSVPDLSARADVDGGVLLHEIKTENSAYWDATKLGEFVHQTCLSVAPDYAKLDALFEGSVFKSSQKDRWENASTTVQLEQFDEACGCIVIAPVATSPTLGDELFDTLQRELGADFLGVATSAEGFKYARVQTEDQEVQVSWDFPAPPELEGVRFVAVFSNLPGQCRGEVAK